MKYVSVLGLVVVLFSCSKKEQTCVARTANGEAKYEVKGATVCQNQIFADQGEYCDCKEK